MKLTKENYEMQMFDLLEGNLTEAEELVLLEQIESDPFFAEEWKLFSETVLEPEHIVFERKNELLKEEKAIVIPMRTRWQILSYAAAVAAIFFGLFWFVQKGPEGEVVNGSTPPRPNITSELPVASESETPEIQETKDYSLDVREEDIAAEKAVVVSERATQKIGSDKHTSKGTETVNSDQGHQINPRNTVADNTKDNKIIEEDLNGLANKAGKMPEETQTKEIIVDLSPKTPQIPTLGQKQDQNVEPVLRSDTELDALVPTLAYTGLRPFLRRSAQQALRPFRNPRIRMERIREDDKPAINISFSSDAYAAEAIVLLR